MKYGRAKSQNEYKRTKKLVKAVKSGVWKGPKSLPSIGPHLQKRLSSLDPRK